MSKKKALIMAAGYGTRLEPLTLAVPKPMIPIVNLPVMQHNIELLARYGVDDITANIHYHPEQIENFFSDGYAYGVNLSYSFEKKLLGTAGGVRRMALDVADIKETFIILSSDALTDINLDKLVAFHKKKKALITIALCPVEDVTEFGVVIPNSDGRIIGFQEKPTMAEAKGNLVNAGVYVMEPEVLKMIPDGFFDFGKQLFPKLVEEKAPLYAYQMVEYWSDVGGLEKYICSSYDAIRGAVQVRIPGKKTGSSTWIGEREKIDASARFEGSVIIGDRCRIGRNVYIKDSIIGDKCVIDDNAIITGSVLWSDIGVEHGAEVNQSVIGNWCNIGHHAKVKEGSVISNRSIVSPKLELPALSKLLPNSIIVFLLVFLTLFQPVFAQENIGARPASMGGAFIAVADDANAVFVNPAGTGELKGRYAAFSLMSGSDRDNTLIYGVEHTPDGSIGVGYMQANAHDESAYSASGDPATVVNTFNQTLVLAFGKHLNDEMVVPEDMGQLMVGANLKLIKKTGTTFAGLSYGLGTLLSGELSLVYRFSEWLSYGLNVSSSSADASEYFKSANSDTYKFRVGGAFHSPDKKIILCAETNSVGAEYKFNDRLAFRGGKDGGNSTLGLGAAFNNFTVDYAYVDGTSPLNYFTLSWGIEKK